MAGHHSPEEIRKHIRFYIGILIALGVLTVVTVGISFIHIGPPDSMKANIIVGMIIASVKAALVALFFMHLSSERRTIYRVLVFTVIFVIGLYFLTSWALHDVPVYQYGNHR